MLNDFLPRYTQTTLPFDHTFRLATLPESSQQHTVESGWIRSVDCQVSPSPRERGCPVAGDMGVGRWLPSGALASQHVLHHILLIQVRELD
jgi:hypothetical protein